MAIVLKGKEALDDDSTLKRSPSKHTVSKTNKNSIPKSIASEIKEGAYSWTNRNEFSMYTLPLCYCIHFDALSPTLKPREDVKEKSGDTNPHFKRRVRRSGAGTLSSTDLESLASISSTEEVIGIITMKDVIEELLQNEIQDESAVHVDFHNKIRVSLPSSRRSSPSPARVSVSPLQRKSPERSPLSSYAPISQAQISPYIQPFAPPTSTPTIPSGSSAGPMGKSPTLSQSGKAWRKSYQKLDPAADS
ncbi:hypothetical protein CRG98_016171 [Punica granatum]|uniref:CBS domain-containing protein n=1 Tax=Punica granatum TaxID=22663 RepID=A0A2I0K4P1_PUNGR|nr:hypothetical protein CRG98_016171 [Punica granatum]